MPGKYWNGRPQGVLPSDQWKGAHLYVGAASVKDVKRLCEQLGFNVPSDNEISKYWSKGWGDAMKDVLPQRGLWITVDNGKPEMAGEFLRRTARRHGIADTNRE